MSKRKSGESNKGKNKPSGKSASVDPKRINSRHEAGHAVAAVKFGFIVFSIDIVPKLVPGGGGKIGQAGADFGLPNIKLLIGKGEDAVINILVTLFAGYQAERKLNPDAGLEIGSEVSDGQVAYRYAAAAICKTQDEVDLKKNQINALMMRGVAESEAFVKEHEHEIDALANALYDRGRLSGPEVAQIVNAD